MSDAYILDTYDAEKIFGLFYHNTPESLRLVRLAPKKAKGAT